jgi:hypothetical protein
MRFIKVFLMQYAAYKLFFFKKIAKQALIDMKQFTQKNQQQMILNRLRLSDV